MSVSAYASATATILLQLAEAANRSLATLVLPNGWSPLQTFTSPGNPTTPASQGFYAQGQIGGATVAVLALGVPWPEIYNNLYSTGLNLTQPAPPGVAPAGAGNFEGSAGAMYSSALRSAIWTNLPNLPLYVAGKGQGASLAQLASVDLRPGNTGPAKQPGPATAPTCYAFSAPLVADSNFASYYQQNVPSGYSVVVGNSALPVDLFPTVPTTAYGNTSIGNFYAPLGSVQTLPANLPLPDDPWVERSQNFYLSALGGFPSYPPTQPASIPNPPQGFSQNLAFALSQLCAVACTQFQQPNLPIQIPIQPYTLQANLTSVFPLQYSDAIAAPSPSVVCSIFSSPGAVAVAFRGMVTWAEVLGAQGNAYQNLATFLPQVSGGYTSVSQGAINIYTGPATASPTSVTFRQALAQTLQSVWKSGQSLYLTGHDFGGVLATIACYDLVSQPALPQPTALYTFGSQPAGDYVFAPGFNAAFSSSYQVMRPADFVARVNPSFSYEQVNQTVTLLGVPPGDDDTRHTITSYIQLLNPAGFGASSAVRKKSGSKRPPARPKNANH